MPCDRKIGPYDCCSVVQGESSELMNSLPDGCADLVFADPPYGVKKASWDCIYLNGYERQCIYIGRIAAFTPGIVNLPACLLNCGKSFTGLIAARNMNGMARGPLGFGNWIPVVICGKAPQGPDAFDFCVSGEMPDHPSPKPLEFMLKIIQRLTDPGQIVIDPYFGSGTTGEACVRLGRHFLGFDINEEYCKIARDRIARVEAQPTLFEPKLEQMNFLDTAKDLK